MAVEGSKVVTTLSTLTVEQLNRASAALAELAKEAEVLDPVAGQLLLAVMADICQELLTRTVKDPALAARLWRRMTEN
ncbi:MAG: hypothetical protein H5U00_11795 [Clostridia bacterium]|nr:hypothetical protein [Clostridia bacterium]